MDNTATSPASSDAKAQLVQAIKGAMSELETDVSRRNAYINRRYGVVYKGEIMDGLKIKSGFDRTSYNYLPRVIDIHASQMFGRMFQVVSGYVKEDLMAYEIGVTDQAQADIEKEKARLRNARKGTDAQIRNEAIKNIMKDNDADAFWSRAGVIASWSGDAIIKHWLDRSAKKYKMSLIEQPQNFYRYWSNSNFRESELDMYAYQMSLSKANRIYGKKLKEGEKFEIAQPGVAWQHATAGTMDLERSTIKNTWVVDATGYVPGIKADAKGNVSTCDMGDETELSVLIIGNVVVQVLTKDLPRYEVIHNLEESGYPWGRSDISDELIEVNQTIIETMSDWRTASWKLTFPKLKFIGFGDLEMPKFNDREAQGFPMEEGQDVAPIGMQNTLGEFPQLLTALWDSFTKLSKVSRVMLDDPTVNTASNAGLMTSMKPLIDVTEDKQKRWSVGIDNIFTAALKASASLADSLDEAVNQQEWWLTVKYPSVLRREDQSYQQMYLNRWNSGTISPESYLEAMGDDAGEEIERIRDALTDPVRAAMIGRDLAQLSSAAVKKALGIPAWGYVIPKVQLRGDLAPSEVGNIAHNYQWDQGPYGDTVGPQGMEGTMANQDFLNAGMFNGEPRNGGTPAYQHAGQAPSGDFGKGSAPNPVLTPDQNTGQGVVSQPGSGATGVSAQGAINQMHQQGR